MSKRIIPVKKNEIYKMKIHDIGTEGQGIGQIEGYTIFVEGALPEEEIDVRIIKVGKKFGFGRLESIIASSKERVVPICKIAKQCGGCSISHLSYKGQLVYKENKVKQLIKRIGGLDDIKVNPTIGMKEPYYYRNKVQYPVRESDGKIKIGYYRKRSHQVVETDICYIQDRRNEEVRQIILDWMMKCNITPYNEEKHKGLIRHIITRHSHSTKIMHITLVINGNNIPKQKVLENMLDSLDYISGIGLNKNTNKTNVIMGKEMISLKGNQYIEDIIGDIRYRISPTSFFQINPIQTLKLYNVVREYAGLTGKETVLDLYCGIGSISLFLAKEAKEVIGVEIVSEAIKDAKYNATLNQIDNTKFYVGKVEEVVPRLYKEKQIKANVVVVDPPRKGCDESLLNTIIDIEPEKIVYVSCDPATLARDLKYLTRYGYQVKEVQPIDMFPHSVHVECIVRLHRND